VTRLISPGFPEGVFDVLLTPNDFAPVLIEKLAFPMEKTVEVSLTPVQKFLIRLRFGEKAPPTMLEVLDGSGRLLRTSIVRSTGEAEVCGLTPGHYVVRLHGVDTYNPVEFDYEGEPEVILSLEPSEAGF